MDFKLKKMFGSLEVSDVDWAKQVNVSVSDGESLVSVHISVSEAEELRDFLDKILQQ